MDGLAAYRSDIKRRLKAGAGNLTPEDIRALCRHRAEAAERLEVILSERATDIGRPDGELPEDGPVFRYPEWDDRLGDYLPEHVRVRERVVAGRSGRFLLGRAAAPLRAGAADPQGLRAPAARRTETPAAVAGRG